LASNPPADVVLTANNTLNTTTNATNDWKTIGDYSSFFSVKDPKTFPTLNCTLLQAGCVKPYYGKNLVMDSSAPWTIRALNNGEVTSNYNDNVCVSCKNKYVTMNYDNFGVGTVDCSDTLFVSNEAESSSIKSEYDRGKNKQIQAEAFFKNDRPVDCPIKTCSLFEKGCKKTLDNENVAISDSNSILVKLSNTNGFDLDACVQCSNGQQQLTYDKWSIS
jgi:hypothetical protein